MNILKKFFCKHEYEYARKRQKYFSDLNGDMIYKRCKRCGKVKKYRYMTNEEQVYFFE